MSWRGRWKRPKNNSCLSSRPHPIRIPVQVPKTSKTQIAIQIGIESIVIMVSVLAAFTVNRWQDEQRDNQMRNEARIQMITEIEDNLAAVEAVVEYHESVLLAAREFATSGGSNSGKSGFDIVRSFAPRGLLPPDIQRTAWETAVATGSLRLFSYAEGQLFARVYSAQELGVDHSVKRLSDRIFDPAMFDKENSSANISSVSALVAEFVSQEHALINLYDTTLERLTE